MRNSLTAAITVLICTPLAFSQTAPTTRPTLRLVPTPHEVHLESGQFPLLPDTPIVVKSDDPADRFAGQQIADEARTDVGLTLPLTAAVPGNRTITLERKSIDLPAEAIAEGYRLTVSPNEIRAEASTSTGLFYAAQTIKQLIRANRTADNTLPAVTIVDYPTLRYRGWQDDISRGPIPTLDYLKSEIRRMSEVKENFFTLYTEHVFKLQKHPDTAPPDGITADEVRELAAYAALYHVELAGNFQSFGHQAHILKLPAFASLGNGWAFKPANEAVYAFLADVYSEIAPAYPSPLFVISCDEVGGFTDPDDAALIKRLGPGGFYAYHINRVTSLLKPYGKTPMMWGDIALQHPDDIEKLSRDLIVLPWTYGDSGNFEYQCKPWADRGYRFIVCPGTSCWNRIWPNVDVAANNISDFTRDGHKFHTLGQLDTTWRDSGETLFGYNYYPLLWGAETAWTPVTDAAPAARTTRRDRFDDCFDGVFYGVRGNAIARANRTLGSKLAANPLTDGMADRAFWTPADTSAAADPDSRHAHELAAAATAVIHDVLPALTTAKYNKDTVYELIFAAQRAQFMGERVIAVNDMTASATGGGAATTQPHPGTYPLIDTARSLRAAYVSLWNAENRPWWLDRNLAKYDDYIKSLESLNSTVAIRPAKSEFTQAVDVTLSPLGQGAVRYTLDKTDPAQGSPLYDAPLHLTKTTTVKARLYSPTGTAGPVAARTYSFLTHPAHLSTALQPYEDHLLDNAFDGDDATFFWGKGPIDTNRGLIVHLDTPTTFHHVKVTTGHPTEHRDTLQTGVVEIQGANDKTWTKVADFKNGTAEADLPDQPIKNIKVRTTEPQKEWLVIREVELK